MQYNLSLSFKQLHTRATLSIRGHAHFICACVARRIGREIRSNSGHAQTKQTNARLINEHFYLCSAGRITASFPWNQTAARTPLDQADNQVLWIKERRIFRENLSLDILSSKSRAHPWKCSQDNWMFCRCNGCKRDRPGWEVPRITKPNGSVYFPILSQSRGWTNSFLSPERNLWKLEFFGWAFSEMRHNHLQCFNSRLLPTDGEDSYLEWMPKCHLTIKKTLCTGQTIQMNTMGMCVAAKKEEQYGRRQSPNISVDMSLFLSHQFVWLDPAGCTTQITISRSYGMAFMCLCECLCVSATQK